MDAQTYVRHHLEFATASPGNRVWFTLVTNQASGGTEPNQQPAIASYAVGDLAAQPDGRLSGRAMHYFSDRRTPNSPVVAPFDENHTDDLGVDIALEKGEVVLTLTAHSWGGGSQALAHLQLCSGVLCGSGGSIGHQSDGACYVVSLAQTIAPG